MYFLLIRCRISKLNKRFRIRTQNQLWRNKLPRWIYLNRVSLKCRKWAALIFSNNLQDIYCLILEDSDNNLMLRASSVNTFGSPEYHKEIRVQLVNYIEANREQFNNFIVKNVILNSNKIRDSYYWGENQELLHFLNYVKQI